MTTTISRAVTKYKGREYSVTTISADEWTPDVERLVRDCFKVKKTPLCIGNFNTDMKRTVDGEITAVDYNGEVLD